MQKTSMPLNSLEVVEASEGLFGCPGSFRVAQWEPEHSSTPRLKACRIDPGSPGVARKLILLIPQRSLAKCG